jgi:hypothetical protein
LILQEGDTMCSLVYLVACTLDGYIAGVDGAFDLDQLTTRPRG